MDHGLANVGTAELGEEDEVGRVVRTKTGNKTNAEQEVQLMQMFAVMMATTGEQIEDPDDETKGPKLLVERWQFEALIAIMIFLNALQMGCALGYPEQPWMSLWLALEHIFTFVFGLEMALKLWALGRAYFRRAWNILDFVLVLIAIIDNWILVWSVQASDMDNLSILRLFRLFRIARLLKVLKKNEDIIVLVHGIAGSLKSMVPISFLVSLLIYAMSLICIEVIMGEKHKFAQQHPPFDANEFFGSLPRAWLTLFNMVILDEWGDIVRPLFAEMPYMVFLFGGFILLCSFAIMNVVIGIICQQTEEASNNCREQAERMKSFEKMKKVKQLVRCIAAADVDGDGEVSRHEFKNEAVMHLLDDLGLPHGFTHDELYMMLDHDGDCMVTIEEFLTSMFRLIYSSPFQLLCIQMTSFNEMKTNQKQMIRNQDKMASIIQDLKTELSSNREGLPAACRPQHAESPFPQQQHLHPLSARTRAVDEIFASGELKKVVDDTSREMQAALLETMHGLDVKADQTLRLLSRTLPAAPVMSEFTAPRTQTGQACLGTFELPPVPGHTPPPSGQRYAARAALPRDQLPARCASGPLPRHNSEPPMPTSHQPASALSSQFQGDPRYVNGTQRVPQRRQPGFSMMRSDTSDALQ